MKKITLILCLSILVSSLYGQDKRHDIQASYGIITTDQIMSVAENILLTIFSLGTLSMDEYSYSGAMFLSYKNAVTNRLDLGACIGIDNITANLQFNNTYIGNFRRNHSTLAGEADLKWLKSEHFQVYSGLGIGYTFIRETGTSKDTGETSTNHLGHLAFQLNALGLRLGKSFGGFMEVGFGYKGILNFGLSYQF